MSQCPVWNALSPSRWQQLASLTQLSPGRLQVHPVDETLIICVAGT
jgi:hypothetical protein